MSESISADLDEQAIHALMAERGIDRLEAVILLGLRQGDLDGDLLSLHPLTSEQRRLLSISRPPEEVLAELGEDDDG